MALRINFPQKINEADSRLRKLAGLNEAMSLSGDGGGSDVDYVRSPEHEAKVLGFREREKRLEKLLGDIDSRVSESRKRPYMKYIDEDEEDSYRDIDF